MAEKKTRRQVIKAAAYVAPVILTLTAKPAKAGSGSGPQGSQSGGSGRPGSGG